MYSATLLVENGAIDAVKRVQWYQALCLQKPLCHKRCMRTPVENDYLFLTMLKYKPCSWFNWYPKIYELYKEKVKKIMSLRQQQQQQQQLRNSSKINNCRNSNSKSNTRHFSSSKKKGSCGRLKIAKLVSVKKQNLK